jgi:cold-inducible RNA-binding protein
VENELVNLLANTSSTYLHLQKTVMKIFVAGLPYDMDDAELEEFFEKFGTVASVKVAMDRETGKSKGFGFVDMPNDNEAKEAIEGLNDISLGRKTLVVKQAEEKQGGGGFRGNNNNSNYNNNRFNNNRGRPPRY